MNLKNKQTLAVLMSIAGAAGTIGTVFLTRKASLKEAVLRHEIDYQVAHGHKNEPTTKEFIKKVLPLYIPSIIVGTATVSSIIGSTVMSNKAQVSLMSMSVLANRGWKRYKDQVKETLGIDKHLDIVKGIAAKEKPKYLEVEDGKVLYFDETMGYFKARPEDVNMAYAKINEVLNSDFGLGRDSFFVSFQDFIKFSKGELVDKNVTNDILGRWGWHVDYLLDAFDWPWVHMRIEDIVESDTPVKVISWIEDPVYLDPETGLFETPFEDD